MRCVGSAAEMLAAPIGSYLAGRSFVVWVQQPARIGALQFGPLDSQDNPTLAALFPLPHYTGLAPKFDLLHDLGAVEVFDRTAFEFFESFLRVSVDFLMTRVRRVAVVRPGGLAGAAFAGMYHEWVSPRFDARLCLDRDSAYEWLDMSVGEQVELEDLYARYLQPPMLREIRRAIAANLKAASLAQIASALAISQRTLQRTLASYGSSFRDELVRMRVRHAEAMLLDGDAKIEAIAYQLGFRSAAAFSTMFLRMRGEPPGEFRARRHGGRADAHP